MIHKDINDNLTSANRAMRDLKPIVEHVNEEFEKESLEGDKTKLVECNRITLEANKSIKALNDIEEKISSEMKSTLQRRAMEIKGQNISDLEVE